MAFVSRVIKTISENTAQNGKVYGMWIMQYYDPEAKKNIAVKVVCGEKTTGNDGTPWYVPKGMSVKDFAALKPHYAEFARLSAIPPSIEIEEVPF
jgi:hypothetical protein